MESREKLVKFRNLGGVLLFYVVISYIGLFMSFVDIAQLSSSSTIRIVSEFSSLGPTFVALAFLFMFIGLGLGCYHMYCIHARNFKKIKSSLIISQIVSIVGSIILLVLFCNMPVDENDISEYLGAIISTHVISLIGFAICMAYFTGSKRVEVYCATDEVYEAMLSEAPYLVYPDKPLPSKNVEASEKQETSETIE